MPELTPHQSRSVEQYYIDKFGMQKLDGILENRRNEIAIGRDIYPGSQEFANDFLIEFNMKK